jgi:hypothetical protein
LHARRGCRLISGHRATCRADVFDRARVITGDRDDSVRIDGFLDASISSGSGDDHVRGGEGVDAIDGGPGRDVLDGGPSRQFRLDTVVYASHRRPVTVRLGDGRPDGAPGEGDVLRRFTNIVGGRGSDVLVGNGSANSLEGGPGLDWLDGRGGDDVLDGGSGSDFNRCGRGDDSVTPNGDFVTPDCDRVDFGEPSEGGNELGPYPQIRHGVPVFRIDCPSPDTESDPDPCGGRISLRTGRGHLLGRARIPRHQLRPAQVRMHLTPLGRALAHRAFGVRAKVLINGLRLPQLRWQIRLRIPPL